MDNNIYISIIIISLIVLTKIILITEKIKNTLETTNIEHATFNLPVDKEALYNIESVYNNNRVTISTLNTPKLTIANKDLTSIINSTNNKINSDVATINKKIANVNTILANGQKSLTNKMNTNKTNFNTKNVTVNGRLNNEGFLDIKHADGRYSHFPYIGNNNNYIRGNVTFDHLQVNGKLWINGHNISIGDKQINSNGKIKGVGFGGFGF